MASFTFQEQLRPHPREHSSPIAMSPLQTVSHSITALRVAVFESDTAASRWLRVGDRDQVRLIPSGGLGLDEMLPYHVFGTVTLTTAADGASVAPLLFAGGHDESRSADGVVTFVRPVPMVSTPVFMICQTDGGRISVNVDGTRCSMTASRNRAVEFSFVFSGMTDWPFKTLIATPDSYDSDAPDIVATDVLLGLGPVFFAVDGATLNMIATDAPRSPNRPVFEGETPDAYGQLYVGCETVDPAAVALLRSDLAESAFVPLNLICGSVDTGYVEVRSPAVAVDTLTTTEGGLSLRIIIPQASESARDQSGCSLIFRRRYPSQGT